MRLFVFSACARDEHEFCPVELDPGSWKAIGWAPAQCVCECHRRAALEDARKRREEAHGIPSVSM